MGYVVWATEMIPTLTPSAQPHTLAILPQGPHFYTWLLQAAGYLLLDGQKKKMLIISQQDDDPKTLLVDTTIYGPIFWQTRETSMTTLSKIGTAIGAKLSTKDHQTIGEGLHDQAPFFRTITDTQELIHIGVGGKTPLLQTKKLLSRIHKNIDQYNIVCIANIELFETKKGEKKNEQQALEKLLIGSKKTDNNIIQLFTTISKYTHQKPQVIAYVNPSDFDKNTSLRTRYVCAVG